MIHPTKKRSKFKPLILIDEIGYFGHNFFSALFLNLSSSSAENIRKYLFCFFHCYLCDQLNKELSAENIFSDSLMFRRLFTSYNQRLNIAFHQNNLSKDSSQKFEKKRSKVLCWTDIFSFLKEHSMEMIS